MKDRYKRAGLHILGALCASVAMASPWPAAASAAQGFQSRPAMPAPYVDTIPKPRDVPFPGVIKLHVDATDTALGIYRIREEVPVSAGPQTLFYPAWQPGAHSIQNPAKEVAGIRITADGMVLPWRRDPVQIYAFHFDVPKGVHSVTVEFEYLSPAALAQGKVESLPGVTWLEWSRMLLYPAGTYTRRISVEAEVLVPHGFAIRSGLDAAGRDGDLVRFPMTDIDTLFDSPALAGAFLRVEPLTSRVELDLLSPTEDKTPIAPEVLAGLKQLPLEARALFGVEHYPRYKFLAAQIASGPVLEHHTSSEQRYTPGFFAKPFAPAFADLLPHEYVHSWNGKAMRPDDLWTPDYQTPMRGTLLWVYEGLTEFYGITLAARSGLMGKDDALDMIAAIAAQEGYQRGRDWKSVGDTALDNAYPLHRPLAWTSYQRQEDFYFEGVLIWLEVDSIIRRETHGVRSLDDFAKAFFGGVDGDATDHTYHRADVVVTLGTVVPYDWEGFFKRHIDETGPLPMAGVDDGGYRLVYTASPNSYARSFQARFGAVDLSYSLGLSMSADGTVSDVIWGGPAFQAGLRPGSTVVAVDGKPFASGLVEQATSDSSASGIVALDVNTLGATHTVAIHWSGGLRYPHLIKRAKDDGNLDEVLRNRCTSENCR